MVTILQMLLALNFLPAKTPRAIKAVGETTVVPLGSYSNTVRFAETTPLEPGAKSTKVYASGVGPLVDDIVRLTSVTP